MMKHKYTEGVFFHSAHLSKAHRDPFGEIWFIHDTSESFFICLNFRFRHGGSIDRNRLKTYSVDNLGILVKFWPPVFD